MYVQNYGRPMSGGWLIQDPSSEEIRHSSEFERHSAKLARAKIGDHVEHDHPGWLVCERILAPMAASTLGFAHAIGVSQDFAECFHAGDHDVDLELAQRLGPFCHTSQRLWLELQQKHRPIL